MNSQIYAALGGASVGALATLVSGFGVYFKRKRDKRERLRIALIQEIDGMKGPIKGYSQAMQKMNGLPETDIITTTIYESNADKIGLLSEEEVKKVTNFYTHAMNTSEELKFLNDQEQPQKTATFGKLKSEGLDNLKDKNEEALEALKGQDN